MGMGVQHRRGMILGRRLAIASPFILFAYPVAALLGGTSQTALILGRYSYAAAGFILAAAALYLMLAVGLLRRSIALLTLATLALVGLTFVLPASNSVLAWPGTLTVLALARLASVGVPYVYVMCVHHVMVCQCQCVSWRGAQASIYRAARERVRRAAARARRGFF